MRKKIGNKVLILGGGRWGQITYNNLLNENFIGTLQIVSKSLELRNSILKKKNIKVQRVLNYKRIKNYNLISICKNNVTKIQYLKKLNNFKNILVIEKPVIVKRNINSFLSSFYKKNFYVSLPWFFETKIKSKLDKFINTNPIKNIKFIWFDCSEKKHGLLKKFDKDIFYTEDIFSHIFSILYNKKTNSKKLRFLSFHIKNNIEYLSFEYNKIRIDLECSNKINKKIKKIVFNGNKKKIGYIKILDKCFYTNDSKKKNKMKFHKKSDALKLQYKYLLKNKNLLVFKNLGSKQILYQNSLYKFCKKSLI